MFWWLNAGTPNVSRHGVHGAHVGIILSKGELIPKIRAYVTAQKGDASTASFHAVFNDNAGGKGCLDRNDVARIVKNADACAPSFGGGCKAVVDGIMSAMDKNGDGCLDWDEFRTGAGLEEEASVPAPSEGFSPFLLAWAPKRPMSVDRAPTGLMAAAMAMKSKTELEKERAAARQRKTVKNVAIGLVVAAPIAYFLFRK